jgi:biopolymer transport protein TolQ
MFVNADFIVQAVMVALLIFSILSWGIIFDKYTRINTILKHHKEFDRLVGNGTQLEQIYQSIKQKPFSPMEKICVSILNDWHNEKEKNLKFREYLLTKNIILKNKIISTLEEKMDLLATISSSAPFVGLFGTVWGIMHSFQSIAVAKNTSLAVVAPGIAEALFATALGLIAAIPALIFSNIFNSKISDIDDKAEIFLSDILNQLFYNNSNVR